MLYQLSYTPAGGWACSVKRRAWQGKFRSKRKLGIKTAHSPDSPHLLASLAMHAPVTSIIPSDLLLTAYRSGIFPMADSRDDPEIFWVEPKRRAILPPGGFHCSHSLRKVLKSERFTVTCNAAFAAVLEACAAPRPEHPDSWISQRIADSYHALHSAGHAHSIECWQDGVLVGGLYGVGFDRVFCGESMFSRATDASKVALAWLVVALRHAGVTVLDCQFMTDHLASLGAIEISQQEYLSLLHEAQDQRGAPWSSLPEGFAGVLAAAVGAAAGVSAAGLDAAAVALDDPSADDPAGASSPGKFIAQFLTQTS